MSVKSFITALSLAVLFSTSAFAAEDASMHQVYLAAEAGKFSEAQAMMDQVLRDHPNSAKAHFVEAELLAKQGQISRAQAEFNTAEKLQPGLPFAKPEALQKLKAQLSTSSSFSSPSSSNTTTSSGLPWGLIALIAGLIAFIYFVVKFMGNRNPAPAYVPANNYANSPNGYAQPYNNIPMQNAAPAGGLGSSIMGGLATGAAVGAGMVAGEALMHHFVDGGHESNGVINNAQASDNFSNQGFNPQDDMGGTDFGINDTSSWDDSSGGGDDWT